MTFPPEGAAIIGENAQGKTNLLEAIYYLESFRSFRRVADDQLVAFDQGVFRVAADLASANEDTSVAAAFDRGSRVKKVTVDGTEQGRLADGLGRVGAVVFSPEDVHLISGGPEARRRFLNVLLSLNRPGYVNELQRYRKALAQRNAILKAGGAGTDAWDVPLVEHGSRVMAARGAWVSEWGDAFRQHYRVVSGKGEARVRYKPSVASAKLDPAEGVEAYAEALRTALAETRRREDRLRTTLVGPHRDDLVIELEGPDGPRVAREYGSGGQRRTAALALRLLEADTIRARRGREPLLLLDDAFAELDEGRSSRIMDLIDDGGTGQVILTAPKESDVRLRRDSVPRWTIEQGVIGA